MVKLCLMAYPHAPVFHPELGFGRVSHKDCQTFWPNHGLKHDLTRANASSVRLHHWCQEPWEPGSGFPETVQFVETESTIRKPILIGMQDTNPKWTLFSYGIAEQCTRHERVLRFLMSGSCDIDGGGCNMSLLPESIGLQALRGCNSQNLGNLDYGTCSCKRVAFHPSVVCPSIPFHAQGPLFGSVWDLVHPSEISLNTDGQVLFTSTGTELKDVPSVFLEYYQANNSTKSRKQTVLVPHFNSEATATVPGSSLLLENMTFAPLKSPDKIKRRPSPKKKTVKKKRGRDLYERNYFYTCESLLSIMANKNRNWRTATVSLKKSGPELTQLLSQVSASIAGTGFAVLLSVVCKVALSRVPFCATKLLNTGIGFGLISLSWAVNNLRGTVVRISRGSGKLNSEEDEIMGELDRRVNDVFFRAAALMAVTVLWLV